jgi:hypothetical protein
MLPAATATPVVITQSASADVTARLACDTTFGCTVSTPLGEQILQVYSTTSAIALKVTAPGNVGQGITEVLPAATAIKVGNDEKPVAGEIDITTSVKTYRVAVTATDDRTPRHLAYSYPPPPVLKPMMNVATPPLPVSSSGEYADLDPTKLDFGYTSRGKITCVAVFAILPDVQLWCRLPDSVTETPVVYFNDMPIHARRVATHYLVIDDTHTPATLIWSDGSKSEIVRTHE